MTLFHVGTSGWHYGHWVGPFYPEGMPAERFLDFYAEKFGSVELNNTFYQLPSRETLAAWRKQTPRDFVFAVKASRYITHMKKLKDPARSVTRFIDVVSALGDKLGPILFQLPPRWRVNTQRLGEFLDALPRDHRYAFEFRDETWFAPEVIDLLRRHDAAFCAYDLDGRQSPVELTTDLAYVRLHGPDGPYRGSYDGRALRAWARRIGQWTGQGRTAFCYFDNDEAGFAARNALRLQEMLAEPG